MNIAKNHLSSLAQKGRMGDDRILQFSDGRIEHGNRQEEKLMGDAVGEALVDAIGSKTINPETGLKENFVGTAIMGATFAMNLIEGSAQKDISREQGKQQAELNRQKLKDLEIAEKKAEESAFAQKKILDLESQVGFKDMTDQFSQKSIELENVSKSTIQKSGGLVSGSATNTMNIDNKKAIENLYESTNEKMIADYGKMQGQIEGDLEVKKAQFKSERDQTNAQIALYDQQANQKGFLGNLGDMISGGLSQA